MDKKAYDSKVLAKLNEWSKLGSTTNDAGTKLIGHVPKVAPMAYVNLVYKPLSEDQLTEFESRCVQSLPKQYKEFLICANGLTIFSDSLRVNGYVPLEREFRTTIQNYPSSFVTDNVTAKIVDLNEGDVVVGWYRQNGHYVKLDKLGQAIQFDLKQRGKVITTWKDFDTWICSEIERLDDAYRNGDIEVFIPSLASSVQSDIIVD